MIYLWGHLMIIDLRGYHLTRKLLTFSFALQTRYRNFVLNNAVLFLDILDADVMTINWIKSETHEFARIRARSRVIRGWRNARVNYDADAHRCRLNVINQWIRVEREESIPSGPSRMAIMAPRKATYDLGIVRTSFPRRGWNAFTHRRFTRVYAASYRRVESRVPQLNDRSAAITRRVDTHLVIGYSVNVRDRSRSRKPRGFRPDALVNVMWGTFGTLSFDPLHDISVFRIEISITFV